MKAQLLILVLCCTAVHAGLDTMDRLTATSPADTVRTIALEAWKEYFPDKADQQPPANLASLRGGSGERTLFSGLGVGFDPTTGVNKYIPVLRLGVSDKSKTQSIGSKSFLVPDGVIVTPSTGNHFPRKTSLVFPTIGDYTSSLRSETLTGSSVVEGLRKETESGSVTVLDTQGLYDGFYAGPEVTFLAQEVQAHILFEASLNIPEGSGQLDPFVQRAIDALPEDYDEASYFEFLYWWGGLYSTSSKMGGVISLEVRLNRSLLKTMGESKIEMNTRRDLLAQVDPSVKPTPPEAAYKQNKKDNRLHMKGGVPDKAVDPTKYREWLATVADNPVVIEATGGLISNLIENEKKRQNLSRAFDKVLTLEDDSTRAAVERLAACEARNNCHGAGACRVDGDCNCDNKHKGKTCEWLVQDRFRVTSMATPYHFGDTPTTHTFRTLEGDLNADGKTDFLRFGQSPTVIFTFISQGSDGQYAMSTQTLQQHFTIAGLDDMATVTGDFNKDGAMDFVRVGGSPTVLYVFMNDGKGKFAVSIQQTGLDFQDSVRKMTYQTLVGDFNGDSMTDFVRIGEAPSHLYHFFSKGDGTFEMGTSALGSLNFMDSDQTKPFFPGFNERDIYVQGPRDTPFVDHYLSFAGDIDGDGKDDIVRIGESPSRAYTMFSNGDGTWRIVTKALGGLNFMDGRKKRYVSFVGDFNHDGKTDVVRMGDGPTNIYTLLSNGDGSFTNVHSPANGWNFSDGSGVDMYESFALDFDGDGILDIVRVGESPTHVYWFRGQGDGKFVMGRQDLAPLNFVDGRTKPYVTRVGDFDGDKRGDFVRIGQEPTVIFTAYALQV